MASQFTPGDFSFQKNLASSMMLSDMYRIVSIEEGWDHLKKCTSPVNCMQCDKFSKKSLIKHSGASFMCVMNDMRNIAQNSWTRYVISTMEYDKQNNTKHTLFKQEYIKALTDGFDD